jgi:hypothetical protein
LDDRLFGDHGHLGALRDPEIDPGEETRPQPAAEIVELGLHPQRARALFDGRRDEGNRGAESLVGEGRQPDFHRLAHRHPARVHLGHLELHLDGMQRHQLEERRARLDVLATAHEAPGNESREGCRNIGVAQRALHQAGLRLGRQQARALELQLRFGLVELSLRGDLPR